MPENKAALSFFANKASGGDGILFTISTIGPVIARSTAGFPVSYPFYALTLPTATRHFDEWILRDEYEKETEKLLSLLVKEGVKPFKDLTQHISAAADLFVEEARVCAESLPDLSDEGLIAAYGPFMERYVSLYASGAITFLYEDILSERLFASLSARYADATSIIHQVLATSYRNFASDSEIALLAIHGTSGVDREKHIEAFLKEFYFIGTNYAHIKILDTAEVEKMAADVKLNEHTEQALPSAFSLTSEEEQITLLLKETDVIHDQRKRLSTAGCYTILRFLDEAIRRTGVERFLAERLFWTEFPDFLKDPKQFVEKLKQRACGSIVVTGGEILYLDYNAVTERAKDLSGVREFKGTPASTGKVSGRVHIVLGSKDFTFFQEGEILVTEMTRPDFIAVMKKAAAIVTDEGGLTSHAAIVAREMKKPCIIGTKIGTRILKDGDMVEVDAEKGIVRKI